MFVYVNKQTYVHLPTHNQSNKQTNEHNEKIEQKRLINAHSVVTRVPAQKFKFGRNKV